MTSATHPSPMAPLKAYFLMSLCLLFGAGCVNYDREEYQNVGALGADDLALLAPKVEAGLGKLGAGIFKVRSLTPESGSRMTVVDGFLYERDLEVVHFMAELELLRDFEPPTVPGVKASIGKEGWSMARVRRDYELALLFAKDLSAKKAKSGSKASRELGAAVAALFGDLGQRSVKGTVTADGKGENSWRVIVRMNFRGLAPLLFEVAPQRDEGGSSWVSGGGLLVFLWREDLSTFSPDDYVGGGELGERLKKARENFKTLAADDAPGTPGGRYRQARGGYRRLIDVGRVWKTRTTGVFDRGEAGSTLHHIGGFWRVDFTPGMGRRP